MDSIIKERNYRLQDVMSGEIYPLLSRKRIDSYFFRKLQFAVKLYIKDCITRFETLSGNKFVFSEYSLPIEDFIIKYRQNILSLTNITPNGLILPKSEVLKTYNYILSLVAELVKSILNLDKCLKIACPVNVRINRGTNTTDRIKGRPKSSFKWHSDIWAGQNSNEVMLHIPIFGDIENNNIEFCYPGSDFFPDKVRTFEDFDQGDINDYCESNKSSLGLELGYAYLADSFLLHKSTAFGDNLRGIISFPIQVQKIDSDVYSNPNRDDEYITTQDFLKLGSSIMITTDKKMTTEEVADVNKNTYADKYQRIYLK